MKRTVLLLAGFLAAATIIWYGCSGDKPTEPASTEADVTTSYLAGLQIGPIEGLTTRWHGAPDRFVIPSGVTLRLKCLAPQNAEVTWSGAREIERDQYGSVAECPADVAGEQRVEVTVTIPPGDDRGKDKPPIDGTSSTHSCAFSVSDISVDEINVSSIELSREPLYVDENSTNMETMRQFFGGSIASVRRLGPSHYRTAAGTDLRLTSRTEPRALAPLTEWRIDGKAILLGERGHHRLRFITGIRAVSIGPPATAREVTLETYSVSFTSDKGGVPIGVPVTFTATTDPRGVEDEIVWLASTKYGTASPVLGQGQTFTVKFDDATGPDGFQWLGVRADNAVVNQDTLSPFEDDFMQLENDLFELTSEFGRLVSCLDSTEQQTVSDAINELTTERSGVVDAITEYHNLSPAVRFLVDKSYLNIAVQLRGQLARLEATIADLQAEPSCIASGSGVAAQLPGFRALLCASGRDMIRRSGINLRLSSLIFPFSPVLAGIVAANGVINGVVGTWLVVNFC